MAEKSNAMSGRPERGGNPSIMRLIY